MASEEGLGHRGRTIPVQGLELTREALERCGSGSEAPDAMLLRDETGGLERLEAIRHDRRAGAQLANELVWRPGPIRGPPQVQQELDVPNRSNRKPDEFEELALDHALPCPPEPKTTAGLDETGARRNPKGVRADRCSRRADRHQADRKPGLGSGLNRTGHRYLHCTKVGRVRVLPIRVSMSESLWRKCRLLLQIWGGRLRAEQHVSKPRIQYGALPFRTSKGQVQILLVTSRETRRWIIPKGWPMKGKSAHRTAEREAFEEAGVVGRIQHRSVGSYRYEKKMKDGAIVLCQVDVFPLKVDEQRRRWPEYNQRETRWFEPEEAVAAVNEPELAALIEAFKSARDAKVAA